MQIRAGGLDDARVLALIAAHLEGVWGESPPESCHALDTSALQGPDMRFWTAWDGETLLGMGGLKSLGRGHFEVKSMHTVRAGRNRGVGSAMLAHILADARARGARRVSLETGSAPYFDAARALYRKHGFIDCQPFADYVLDPHSVYMTLDLESAT